MDEFWNHLPADTKKFFQGRYGGENVKPPADADKTICPDEDETNLDKGDTEPDKITLDETVKLQIVDAGLRWASRFESFTPNLSIVGLYECLLYLQVNILVQRARRRILLVVWS